VKITQRYILTEFADKHPDATNAINKWAEHVERAEWKNHNELKSDYPSADYVSNSRYVFNIRGNNYRLVVVVVFFAGEINIRFIGTHKMYEKINVSTI
jgi:mRNA interferase HigB